MSPTRLDASEMPQHLYNRLLHGSLCRWHRFSFNAERCEDEFGQILDDTPSRLRARFSVPLLEPLFRTSSSLPRESTHENMGQLTTTTNLVVSPGVR